MKATRQPQRQAKPVAAEKPKRPEEKAPNTVLRRFSAVCRFLPPAVFFVIYGLSLWRWINVRLIYHGSGQVQDFPSFYWGWTFVREFRTHPGGLVEYGSALLAQAHYLPWFGALVLTLQAAVIYGTFAGCIHKIRVGPVRILALVPPLLLLAIYSMYRHYSVPVSSYAFGSMAAWVWWRWGSSNHLRRLAAAWGIVVLLLSATAPSALLVFFPAVICRELLGRTRWSWVLFFLVLSAFTPPVEGRMLFGFGAGEAYAKVLPLPWDPMVLKMSAVRLLIGLYAFPLAFWAGIAIWQCASHKKDSGRVPDARPLDQTERVASAGGIKRHAWKLEFAACAMLPIAVVWLSLNSQVNALMQLDFFAWHGQWPEALAVSAKANSRSPFIACAVAQASYHTGKLLTQLPSLQSPAIEISACEINRKPTGRKAIFTMTWAI